MIESIKGIPIFIYNLFKKIKIVSPWNKVWQSYLIKDDLDQKIQALKSGMDNISNQYINKTLQLYSKYIDKVISPWKAWSIMDTKKRLPYKIFEIFASKKILKKYLGSESFNKYLFYNRFGTRDIDYNFSQKTKNKTILDLGAYIGDSACMFNELFDCKNIIAYEPQIEGFNRINDFINTNNLGEKIMAVKKGIGDKEDELFLNKGNEGNDAAASFTDNFERDASYVSKEKISITTIDNEVKKKRLNLGLIKMDIEGFEKKAIEGARETIKTQKPVLIISIYHNPVDFFEIKPLLQELNPAYKFAIRRAENIIPLGDIVLIAY